MNATKKPEEHLISKLEHFDRTFKTCVATFLRRRGQPAMGADSFAAFQEHFNARIPSEVRELIGRGLAARALKISHGFFIAPTCDRRIAASQYLFNGKQTPHPCWELYVQTAEAVQLMPLANRLKLKLRMEDRLMDLTLSRGHELLLYVEVKVAENTARVLVDGIGRWGRNGVILNKHSKADDALKKAKYIVTWQPRIFGVRAIDRSGKLYAENFRIRYRSTLNFSFEPLDGPLDELLSDLARSVRPLARRPGPTVDIDAGWAELKERCPELDLDLGSGTTLYNFYASN